MNDKRNCEKLSKDTIAGKSGSKAGPNSQTNAYYPVFLSISGEPCLVVGGGRVAVRKAIGLLKCGAQVTMVAPEISPDAHSIEGLTIHNREYRVGEAKLFRLVITATGIRDVDALVSKDAKSWRVWVNSADDLENCSFLLPSIHRDGPVSIAVSTGGASPALATWLRKRIAQMLNDDLSKISDLLASARRSLKSRNVPTESINWAELLNGEFVELVNKGEIAQAQTIIAEMIEPKRAQSPSVWAGSSDLGIEVGSFDDSD